MADDDHAVNAQFVEHCRNQLGLPRDLIAGGGSGCASVANEIDSNHAVVFRQRGRDVVPPVNRSAVAVQEQDGRPLTFRFDVRRLDTGLDDPAPVARRRDTRLGVNPCGVGCQSDSENDDARAQDEQPSAPRRRLASIPIQIVRHDILYSDSESLLETRLEAADTDSSGFTVARHRIARRFFFCRDCFYARRNLGLAHGTDAGTMNVCVEARATDGARYAL